MSAAAGAGVVSCTAAALFYVLGKIDDCEGDFLKSASRVNQLKMLGLKKIERVLPTGTPLTVVGEAVKNVTGSIRIQQPHNGSFYVPDGTIDVLIASLGESSRWLKCASLGCSLLGVCLLALDAILYLMKRMPHRQPQNRCGHMCCCKTCFTLEELSAV